LLPFGDIATPLGFTPTGIVAITLFVGVFITDTVPELLFVIYAFWPRLSPVLRRQETAKVAIASVLEILSFMASSPLPHSAVRQPNARAACRLAERIAVVGDRALSQRCERHLFIHNEQG
jgi:hypothetical protein